MGVEREVHTRIANPIYDSVFKYLMDDSRIARLLIGKIIGEEVVELDFLPLEQRVEVEDRSFTIYRMDFCARIRMRCGKMKQVIIEIQKAKYATDIMRFRKYLGRQYLEDRNSYEENGRVRAIPIVSIYFLGHSFESTDAPVIKVERRYKDVIGNWEIKTEEEFIESLTHDSYFIQIPYLKNKCRNELEQILSVFDQSNVGDDHHILNISEDDFPIAHKDIIRRLQRAASEPEVRSTMDAEDQILRELATKERWIMALDEEVQDLRRKGQKLRKHNKKLKKEKKCNKKLKKHQQQLEATEERLAQNDAFIRRIFAELQEKDRIIQELQAQNRMAG